MWEPAVSINMKRAYAAWRKKDSGAAGGAVATAEEATTADQGGADDWAADAAAAARVAAQPNGPWSKAVKEAAKRARDRIAARDAAYEACDEEGDIDGNSDDDDGDVDHSAADAVAARAAQLEFHQKNVASLNSGELNLATVPHTRLRPPDAWRQPFTGVGPFMVIPIEYFDPESSMSMHEVKTPCAFCGWEHTDSVRRRGWRGIRLVRDIYDEYYLSGRDCVCLRCKAARDVHVADLCRARASHDDVAIAECEAAVKNSPCRFMSYDPRVLAFYVERYPWVAHAAAFSIRKRSALGRHAKNYLLRGLRTGRTAADIEAEVKEHRGTEHEHLMIMFYSLQKSARERSLQTTIPQYFGPDLQAAPIDYTERLPMPPMPFSDTYIRDVQVDDARERQKFNDLFSENFGCQVAQIDHSLKRLKAMQVGGVKYARNVLTIMNEWGGIVTSVAVPGTAFSDHVTEATLKAYRALAAGDSRAPIVRVWLDAVFRDGPPVRRLLGIDDSRAEEFDASSFGIVNVTSESEMDAAATALEGCDLIAIDTEFVSARSGGAAECVQLCGKPDQVFLLHVRNWSSAYPSFVRLMQGNLRKVSHYKHNEEKSIAKRFPGVTIAKLENLVPLATCAAKTTLVSKKLDDICEQLLGRRIPGKGNIDHSRWAEGNYSDEQCLYAASDAAATLMIAQLGLGALDARYRRSQPPPGDGGADSCDADHDRGDDAGAGSAEHDLGGGGGGGSGAAEEQPRPEPRRFRWRTNDARDSGVEQVLEGLMGHVDGNDDDDEGGGSDDEGALGVGQIDADALGSGPLEQVLEGCRRLVLAYAGDSKEARELVLPACLTSDQRKGLHDLCRTKHLNSFSSGVGGARRLVVSRRRPAFVVPSASVGSSAIGCTVLKAPPSQIPRRGVVKHFDGVTSQWGLLFDDGSSAEVGYGDLCRLLRARSNFDQTGDAAVGNVNDDEHETSPSWSKGEGAADAQLAALLAKIKTIEDSCGCAWHETAAFKTGQDHSHWIRNVMEMVSSSPDDKLYQICMLDLSDVLFKMVDGEKERLTGLMTRQGGRYTPEQMSKLPRSWWRKWARYHCPEPRRMTMDFYDWYQFWSTLPVPGGKPFFVPDSMKKFNTAAKYILHGHLSDKPGLSPYVVVRMLADGRHLLRCLRTSSPLEGYHHAFNRAQDSMAKCTGPELQNASMRLFQFAWTIKAAIKAKMIPLIYHYELYLRYRLIQICKGTCHETTLDAIQGWPHVDMTKTPTVPRGTDLTTLLPVDPRPGNDQKPPLPHSRLPGVAWVASHLGHGAPTDLAGTGARAALAAHPSAILRDTQAPTLDDQRRFHDETRLAPTRTALASFAEQQQKEQLDRQALRGHGFGQHVQGMRTTAPVSARPLVLERPRGPGAAAAPAQPLPVSTWGSGLAPRAAAVAAPAVAAPAAPAAAPAAPVAPTAPTALAASAASKKEKARLRMQLRRHAETAEEAAERRAKNKMQVSGKRKSETEVEKNQRNERRRALRQQNQDEEEAEGSASEMEEEGGCGGAGAGGVGP